MALAGIHAAAALAADYVINMKGANASINFEVNHLGYSFVTGRFDKFSGNFSFDENAPQDAEVSVEIDTTSVNSNHAERDNHIRSGDFLDVVSFPKASFESTGVEVTGDKTANIKGNLTLHGVTKEVVIAAQYSGGGKDPWGGFRQGFVASTEFAMKDFGIPMDLGPASRNVKLTWHVKGIGK